ncbi:MAG: hypothetical protein KAI43_08430 [Candidatus Aureabacteria bacterium]|nr:hypothetical protein [Candidatus Auribacterota bacterium]
MKEFKKIVTRLTEIFFKRFFIFTLIFIFFTGLFFLKIIFLPKYRSEAEIMISPNLSLTSVETPAMEAQGALVYMKTNVALLKSDAVLREVVEQLNLVDDIKYDYFQLTVGRLLDNIMDKYATEKDLKDKKERKIRKKIKVLKKNILKIKNEPFTFISKIKAEYSYRDKVDKIVSVLISEYSKKLLDIMHSEAKLQYDFVLAEAERSRREFHDIQDQMERFQREYNIALSDSLALEAKIDLETLSRYNSELNIVAISIKEKTAIIKNLKEKFTKYASNLKKSDEMFDSSSIIESRNALVSLEHEYFNVQRNRYATPGAAESIRRQINELKKQMKDKIRRMVNDNYDNLPTEPFIQDILKGIIENESEKYALISKKEALKDIVDIYERKLKDLPALEMEMVRFKMDLTTAQKVYQFLIKEQQKNRIIMNKEQLQVVKIISPALPPVKTSGKFIILALCLGSACAVCLFIIIFIDLPQRRIRSKEDLAEFQKGISSMRTVPKFPSVHMGHKVFAERNIRDFTRTLYSNTNGSSLVVQVISINGKEGKSFLLHHWAVFLNKLGLKPVIINLNTSGSAQYPNLEEVTSNEEDSFQAEDVDEDKLEKIMTKKTKDGIDYFYAGGKGVSPVEYYLLAHLKDFIPILRRHYKVIFIENTPTHLSDDWQTVIPHADMTLLVTQYDKTSIEDVEAFFKSKLVHGRNVHVFIAKKSSHIPVFPFIDKIWR